LPSSLTEVLPIALHFSCRLPVSVCGTGTRVSTLRGFSRQFEITHLWPCGTAHCLGSSRGFANGSHFPCSLAPPMSNRQAGLSYCVTPSLYSGSSGILTGCPSPTALALGLGPTNPTRITLASEPSGVRRSRFSREFRYLCQHSHFRSLHPSSPSGFSAFGTLPYHSYLRTSS
jgi:hypothetical protein